MNQVNNDNADRDAQLAAYQRQIEQFEAKLNKAQKEVESGRAKIASLNHTIFDLGARIRNLSESVASTTATVASMAASPSWRLTSPLRKIKRLISPFIGRSQAEPFAPKNLEASSSAAHPIPAVIDGKLEHFDEEFYLSLYPEVRSFSGGTPYDHFLAFGKSEGRLGSLPSITHLKRLAQLDTQRQTVLVVSHEASATGAPVLGLNLIWELKKKYNVVSLILTGGSIVEDFELVADVAFGPVCGHGVLVFKHQVRALLSAGRFKFAIVNSAASRVILPELAIHFIPAIALIHEFAASMRPRSAVQDTIFWASEAIFSADIVRENALSFFPELSSRLPDVIPQGKCSHLPASLRDSSSEFATGQIKLTFRPAGWLEDTLVVLGIGSIQFRKGIDLFIHNFSLSWQNIQMTYRLSSERSQTIMKLPLELR